MKQEFPFPNLIALEGINAATALKVYPKAGNGLFYTQTSGNEKQLKLSLYKSTAIPGLPLPAVTFTSSKFALDLSYQIPGMYSMYQTTWLADKALNG
jgi:hypothetical protein